MFQTTETVSRYPLPSNLRDRHHHRLPEQRRLAAGAVDQGGQGGAELQLLYLLSHQAGQLHDLRGRVPGLWH